MLKKVKHDVCHLKYLNILAPVIYTINLNFLFMKRILLLFSLLLMAGTLAMAQTVMVSGTVTGSEDGMPLPGVNITVKGTTVGAISG